MAEGRGGEMGGKGDERTGEGGRVGPGEGGGERVDVTLWGVGREIGGARIRGG